MTRRSKPERKATPPTPTDAAQSFLFFEQTLVFTRRWLALGFDDGDMRGLEATLITQPTKGDTVARTGGCRKLRLAPDASERGSRGACRVIYRHFEEFSRTLLVVVYSKSEAADLSDKARKYIREVIAEVEKELRSKAGQHGDPNPQKSTKKRR